MGFDEIMWQWVNQSLQHVFTGNCTVLGVSYNNSIRNDGYDDNEYQNPSDKQANENALLSDIYTRIRFTYRSRFYPIDRDPDGPSPLSLSLLIAGPIFALENLVQNSGSFTSDIGWGCMIRTGQSLLANAIQIALLNRGFRIKDDKSEMRDAFITQWFRDTPQYPFSLHNFVYQSKLSSNTKPGEWLGPAAIAQSIKSLVAKHPEIGIHETLISVSSADVYQQDVEATFAKDSKSNILILLGVKLGISEVSERYWDHIKNLLSSRFTVGIAGGRPSSSLYFFGYVDSGLMYFDPHLSQPHIDPEYGESINFVKSCHTNNFGILSFSDMDPSMLIGFLVCGREQWDDWANSMRGSDIVNVMQYKPENFDIATDKLPCIDGQNYDCGTCESFASEDDYVDVGSLWKSALEPSLTQDFQELDCKHQDIVVMDTGTQSENLQGQTHTDNTELERVLVERESPK